MIRIYSHSGKKGWQSCHELLNLRSCVRQGWSTQKFVDFLMTLPDAEQHFTLVPYTDSIPISQSGFYLIHHGNVTSCVDLHDLISITPRVRDQVNAGELTLLIVFVMEAFDTRMSVTQWQDRFCSELNAIGITRNSSVRVLINTWTPHLQSLRDPRVHWSYYPFLEAAMASRVKTNWKLPLPEHEVSEQKYNYHHMIRLPREHRMIMAMLLEYRNLTPLGYNSFPGTHERHISNEGKDNVYWNGIRYYPHFLRWMTGRRALSHRYQDSDHTDNDWLGCSDIYKHSPLELISETHHVLGDGIFLTEKTFRSIFFCKPFLLYGCRHSLKLLRRLGYETFHNVWSEDYDDLACPMENLWTICDVLESIVRPKPGVKNVLEHESLHEITAHNQKIFLQKNHAKDIAEELLTYVGS